MYIGLGNLLTRGGFVSVFPNEYSFNFDGSNDYLDCGNSTGIQFSGSFSVSFWFNTTDATATNEIFVSQANDGVNDGWLVRLNSSRKLEFEIYRGGSILITDSGSASNDGNWHHVVAVHESGVGNKLYKNGILVASNSTGTDLTEHVPNLHIGNQDYSTPRAINSLIDEVALWDTALDATTIGKISSKVVDLKKHSASNLKLWLRAGDKVQPESNTSIARADYSAEFDGSSDSIEINDYTGMSIGGSDHTITGWVKFNALNTDSAYTGIIYNGESHSSHGHVGINPTNYLIGGTGGGDAGSWITLEADTDAGRFTTTGTWHHIAQVRQNNILYLYKDGIMVKSASHNYTPHALNEPPNIARGGGGEYFNGAVSHAGIFKTALPANDIALMAKSRFTPTRDYMLKQVDFDGTNDYITIPSFPLTGTHTFSMWVKPNDNTGSGVNELLYLKNDADNCLLVWHTGTGNSAGKNHFTYRVRANGNQNQAKDSTNEYQGEWILLTGVNSSSGTKLYVNGSEVASVSGDKTDIQSGSTNDYYIGYPSNSADGSIISFGFYNDAKDADFIYAQYAKGLFADWSADSGLSGYWRMGSGTGDTYPIIIDQSSNSNNGTMTSMASDDIVENMVAGYDLGSFRGAEELGGELVGDPSFDTGGADNITGLGSYAVVTGGALVFTDPTDGNTGSTNPVFKKGGSAILESGKIYKFVFTIADAQGSGARLQIVFDANSSTAGSYSDHQNYTDGTHTVYTVSNSTNAEFNISGASPSFKMTDVSIKEVLSSAVDDTKNAVIDVSNPVLGGEVNNLANALSPTNEANATTGLTSSDSNITSVSDVTYSGNYSIKFETDANAESMYATSNFTVENGKLYKFSVTWKTTSSSHAMKHLIGTNYYNGSYINIEGVAGSTDWVTSDYYFVTTSTALNFMFAEFVAPPSEIVMYIDNISIKKVQGNVGTPTSMDATNFPYTSVLPDQYHFG